jgi:hypothetical protein
MSALIFSKDLLNTQFYCFISGNVNECQATMAYATSLAVTDVDTHICGACKTQFAAIEDFLLHKRNGCFSFLTTLPASLLSEYLSSVVVIPSSDVIGPDILSNQYDLSQQQMCRVGAELIGFQGSSLSSATQHLLELQQNSMHQVTDVSALVNHDQCTLDEISSINLSNQLGFEGLSSESVVQLSQLMVEASATESVADGNTIISSVLSQTDESTVISQCEPSDPSSLLLPYTAADVISLKTSIEQLPVMESFFDEGAEVRTLAISVFMSCGAHQLFKQLM